MQRDADKPEGAEEAAVEQAEEAEAPAGEGDDEAQYEITHKGEAADAQVLSPYISPISPLYLTSEAADAQVLADATQEQFEKEEGAVAEEESKEEEGAPQDDGPEAVPEVAQEEEVEAAAGAEEEREKPSKQQKQGRLRPAAEAPCTLT